MPDFDIFRSGALDGVPHGFFGHSAGLHQFGYGGEGVPSAIANTRAQAANALVEGAAIVAPHQVHSPDVLTVVAPWEDSVEGRPVADAVVTAQRGVALGTVTADCAPVLFADRKAGVIGAAHAGWRGAVGGVLENTLDAMEALGASRGEIAAAIGPTIARESYEVDAPFRDRFEADDDRFFAAGRPDHWQFDLPGYAMARLAKAGVRRVEDLALDTYAAPDRFYSYRLATQRGEPNYGRQISMIALP